MAGFIVLMAPASIRGSSNGRTPGFGPGYRGSNPCPRAKLYVASLLPRRFAPRQADCIVFAKIFWVQSPPFAKAKRGSSQSF